MIKLIHGDCLEKMKDIESGSVDMILADPPYGTTQCKWDSIIPLEPMWEQLKRIIKPNGAIVLFGSEPFSSFLRCSNIKQYKYDWIWEKTRPTGSMSAKKQPLRNTESIIVFYKKQPLYNPQMNRAKIVVEKKRTVDKGEALRNFKLTRVFNNNGLAYPRTILKFNNPNYKSLHPTQKPVALMEYLIKTYTNENETILDFSMGSGTTGVAAKNLNRSFIGIELDEVYFAVAETRIKGAIE